MPNAWIQHVKDWSKSHGISYGCAISKPECKSAYQGRKAAVERSVKGKAKVDTKKQSKKLFEELNLERLKRASASSAPSMPTVRVGKKVRVKKSQLGKNMVGMRPEDVSGLM